MSPSHHLVVLKVLSGSGFPTTGKQLLVRGQLAGVWLVGRSVSASSTPVWNDELVWEISAVHLRQCRSRKIMLRVEFWLDKDLLGHLVLDLRTASPLTEGKDKAPDQSYRLIGASGCNVLVSLGLEEVNTLPLDISEENSPLKPKSMSLPLSGRSTPATLRASKSLSPILMENKEGGGGYFLIGDEDQCNQKYSLAVCILSAENLQILPNKNMILRESDSFYFQYSLLGVDISTEEFHSLDSPDFLSEKATAMIHSNQENMEQFLSTAGVSFKLIHGSSTLGSAELELKKVLPQEGLVQGEFTCKEKLDIVSASNLSVPRDKEGNSPKIGILILLESQDMKLSSGELSDAEMDADDTDDRRNFSDVQMNESRISSESIISCT